MIFGDYPCCDGPLALAMPERTPTYAQETCPHCGANVWHLFSRIEPTSWTEVDFLALFDVDPVARSVTRKPNP